MSRFLALCSSALFAVALSAAAEPVTFYSTYSSFSAASGPLTVSDFSVSVLGYKGTTYVNGGVTFTADRNGFYNGYRDVEAFSNTTTASYAPYLELDNRVSDGSDGPAVADDFMDGTQNQTLTFAPTLAFGGYFGDYYSSETLTFLLDGNTFTLSVPKQTQVFAGFTSTTPFTTLKISGDDIGIDTIQTFMGANSPSVTPEPSSLALLGTGALGLIGAARRRYANC